MLGVTEAVVREQIAQLEKEGILLQYSVVVNEELLDDDNSVIAFIEVKCSPERDQGFDLIANRLQKFQEVQSVYLMSGLFDLLVVVKGKNLKDVAAFVSSKLSPLANVISTGTHFLLKKYKENGIVMSVDEDRARRLNFTF
jgi:DNA-binding Lrp family transcriptional regulator